jgi:hypothetical protein
MDPDADRILQFLDATECNLECLQQDIKRIQIDLHQVHLLDIDRTPAPEDIIFIDASTFEDQ